MAKLDDNDTTTPAPKRSRKALVLIVLASVLLLGGAGAATMYTLGMLPGGGGDDATSAAPAAPSEAIYVPLEPAFTVNFGAGGGARFLQVSVEAMTRDAAVEPQIKRHMPVIRNDLTLLFSSQSASELATVEGKEVLRTTTLETIRKILQTETGKPGVEAVYFTSFVMQ